MTKEEISKEAAEKYKTKPVGYESNLELDIYVDGYKDGATSICKNIVKTLITTGLNNGKYGTLDEYNHIILRVGDIEECIKDLGINIYD